MFRMPIGGAAREHHDHQYAGSQEQPRYQRPPAPRQPDRSDHPYFANKPRPPK